MAPIGVVDLATGATLAGHDIVGVLESETGATVAWERKQSWPGTSPTVSQQLRLAHFECSGALAWTTPFPEDWADFDINLPLIPLSALPSGQVFACAHDRCATYGSDGNQLWASADSHALLGAFWMTGDPAHVNPRKPESLVLWKDEFVRFEGGTLHLGMNPPWPAVWTLPLGPGSVSQLWTQPAPADAWFEGAQDLVVWSSDPKDLHFRVLAVLPNKDAAALLVFADMDYVEEWYMGKDSKKYLYLRPTPLIAEALPGGKWGTIKRLHVPLLSEATEPARDGALHSPLWTKGGGAIVAISSHVLNNPLSAEIRNQFVELSPSATIRTMVSIPGTAFSDTVNYAPNPKLSGRLVSLPSDNFALLRSKYRLESILPGPVSIPEVVLLDANGNYLAAAELPLPWNNPNDLAAWEDLPPSTRAWRGALLPVVSGRTSGHLLVAAERSLWRTTPWLQFSPSEAGVCENLTLADCGDNDPCTADLCDPIQGCVHPPHPDGANCGSGKSCQSGACKAVP